MILWAIGLVFVVILCALFAVEVIHALWRHIVAAIVGALVVWAVLVFFATTPYETHRLVAAWVEPILLGMAPLLFAFSGYALWKVRG